MDTNEERLQKYLARAGVASRRHSEELITAGRVAINGVVVTKLGTKVRPYCDEVTIDGKPVELAHEELTLLLHKPAGYVTTMSDPQGRPCVADLVPVAEYPNLYPIGRLDRDTTGALLFSTDGALGNALLHPSRHVTKTYIALVEGCPTPSDLRLLSDGVVLDDGITAPAKFVLLSDGERQRALAQIGPESENGFMATGYLQRHTGVSSRAVLEKNASVIAVEIHEGKNRQIRRMFDLIGHPVIALHREIFGTVAVTDLPRGSWRILSNDEVARLRNSVK